MNLLADASLIREMGLLASAVAGVHAIKYLRGAPRYDEFDSYPCIKSTPSLARALLPLLRIEADGDVRTILDRCELLMRLSQSDSPRGAAGFECNRLSADIPKAVRALLARAQRAPDVETAIFAMDYERDELLALESVCDNVVRNMLLDSTPQV